MIADALNQKLKDSDWPNNRLLGKKTPVDVSGFRDLVEGGRWDEEVVNSPQSNLFPVAAGGGQLHSDVPRGVQGQ